MENKLHMVPVPKTPQPKDLNSYRPVALTLHLMKTLERLVHLRPLVSLSMDPLQFAYQPGIGVDDTVIYLLHRSLSHLEKAENTVRICFLISVTVCPMFLPPATFPLPQTREFPFSPPDALGLGLLSQPPYSLFQPLPLALQ